MGRIEVFHSRTWSRILKAFGKVYHEIYQREVHKTFFFDNFPFTKLKYTRLKRGSICLKLIHDKIRVRTLNIKESYNST